ncbi:MAG: ABC transporter permease [Roseiflexaceae bacterium]|nr:ABC transporter permease [Roseiflexaceae bacterium]
MGKGFIRFFAFFSKEINEIRRQPKLVLSLILGPFLILLLFGAGYQGERPLLRTVLVVPESLVDTPVLEQMTTAIEANFQIAEVTTDRTVAVDQLVRGDIEVVEIIPDNIEETVLAGQQAQVEFKYNEINPLTEQWIQYLGYAQVTELNKAILRGEADQLKQEATQTNQELADARLQLDALQQGTSSADAQEVATTARELNQALGILAASPVLAGQLAASGDDPEQTRREIEALREDLTAIEQAAASGNLAEQQERIERASQRIGELEQVTGKLSALPSEVIVSPLNQTYENLYGVAQNFMFYYAPGVLALIVQHIAVTLGALSLVRERLLGAIEFYGVAPVTLTQVLAGKYMAYTLFIGLILTVLMGLMLALGVPFEGDVWLFVGLSALFVLASLGVGFLISAVSSSDSQAIQLSMLVLLLSIFFSGFFLPLDNFSPYVQPVGYIIPQTYGIQGFQDVLLRGRVPDEIIWGALGAIAVVSFVVVHVVWRRQFRRIT